MTPDHLQAQSCRREEFQLSLTHIDVEIGTAFQKRFGRNASIFRAPGRVNLIGEHTDYNDGFVMPAAIGFYTYVAIAPRDDRQLHVYSENFEEERVLNLDSLEGPPARHWTDYVRGVAAVLGTAGCELKGADMLIASDVPIGAGLSSSAALEVSTALALLAVAGATMPREQIALGCQRAENQYTGARCGIMDQFISCFGEADHALLLDCRTLKRELLPLSNRARIVICNTNVKHNLAGGEYNQRRADCEASVRYLQQFLPGIRALRDITLPALEKYGKGLSEIRRTLTSLDAGASVTVDYRLFAAEIPPAWEAIGDVREDGDQIIIRGTHRSESVRI